MEMEAMKDPIASAAAQAATSSAVMAVFGQSAGAGDDALDMMPSFMHPIFNSVEGAQDDKVPMLPGMKKTFYNNDEWEAAEEIWETKDPVAVAYFASMNEMLKKEAEEEAEAMELDQKALQREAESARLKMIESLRKEGYDQAVEEMKKVDKVLEEKKVVRMIKGKRMLRTIKVIEVAPVEDVEIDDEDFLTQVEYLDKLGIPYEEEEEVVEGEEEEENAGIPDSFVSKKRAIAVVPFAEELAYRAITDKMNHPSSLRTVLRSLHPEQLAAIACRSILKSAPGSAPLLNTVLPSDDSGESIKSFKDLCKTAIRVCCAAASEKTTHFTIKNPTEEQILAKETETRVPNADDVAECVLSACKRVTVLIQVALAAHDFNSALSFLTSSLPWVDRLSFAASSIKSHGTLFPPNAPNIKKSPFHAPSCPPTLPHLPVCLIAVWVDLEDSLQTCSSEAKNLPWMTVALAVRAFEDRPLFSNSMGLLRGRIEVKPPILDETNLDDEERLTSINNPEEPEGRTVQGPAWLPPWVLAQKEFRQETENRVHAQFGDVTQVEYAKKADLWDLQLSQLTRPNVDPWSMELPPEEIARLKRKEELLLKRNAEQMEKNS